MSKEMENAIISAAVEGCCGGPAPTGVDACCVADADAKASGDDGCGCGAASAERVQKSTSSCC